MRIYFNRGRKSVSERGWFTFWVCEEYLGAFSEGRGLVMRIPEDKRDVSNRMDEAARMTKGFRHTLDTGFIRRAEIFEVMCWLYGHRDDDKYRRTPVMKLWNEWLKNNDYRGALCN